jgi:nucleotide-binding universal stress UspA family protein
MVATPPDLQRRRVRIGDELARAGRPNWKVTVVDGWPPDTIVEVAKKIGATMIVMGIGRHSPVDRLLGSETALQVMQHTEIPVLAVARDLTGLPRRAVAALDFTEQSEAAARIGSGLVADDGTLHLVHVRTDWSETEDPHVPVDLYAAGVERRFEQLEQRLTREGVAPRVIERVVRSGDPASEILTFADVSGVDLMVVGARTHSRFYRVLLGSVAAKLLRSAHCSVLVLPAKAEHATRAKTHRGARRENARETAAGRN